LDKTCLHFRTKFDSNCGLWWIGSWKL